MVATYESNVFVFTRIVSINNLVQLLDHSSDDSLNCAKKMDKKGGLANLDIFQPNVGVNGMFTRGITFHNNSIQSVLKFLFIYLF